MLGAGMHRLGRSFVVLLPLVCFGCGAHQLPKPLVRTERARLRDAHLKLSVGVIREKHTAHLSAARAVTAFQRLRIFDRVDYVDAYVADSPDLIADFDDVLGASTAIPFAPLLTFGIIPHFYTETCGLAVTFTLGAAEPRSDNKVRVVFRYRSTGIMGWLGIPLWILPEYGIENRFHHHRMYQRLALEIIEHTDEIRALCAAGPGSTSDAP